METILQQLFDGKINPSEQYRPELQQYKDLVRKQNEEYQQFSEQLNKLDPHLEKQFQTILGSTTGRNSFGNGTTVY